MTRFIRPTKVKDYCNERGLSVSKDYIDTLEAIVEAKVRKSCVAWNGHHSRLNGEILHCLDDIKKLGNLKKRKR